MVRAGRKSLRSDGGAERRRKKINTIICDSREQKNQHILKYFRQKNIPYKIQKMDVADYRIEGRDGLVIDRKQNLDELCKNLFNKSDKSRFRKELRRAHEKKIKIIILCEHGGNIREICDIKSWKSAYSGVSGRDLAERIYRCKMAYGVEFIFCDKSETAEKILEILENEGEEN